MELHVTVELGSDAMRSASDAAASIVHALVSQAAEAAEPLGQHECGAVRDRNGNTVGKWEVE